MVAYILARFLNFREQTKSRAITIASRIATLEEIIVAVIKMVAECEAS